jgi:hypothetical protein
VELVFYTCAKLIRKWLLLCKQEDAEKLETWATMLERRSARPPRLTWRQVSGSLAPESQDSSSADQVAGESENGPDNRSLLFRVSPEHFAVHRNVPAVSETIANAASE